MKILKLQNSSTKIALVDDEDFERLSKFEWFTYSDSVAPERFTQNRRHRTVTLSNEIMQQKGIIFDHIDRNPFNNQKNNLRVATRSQNGANRVKFIGTYHSKYKGVSKHKRSGKWQAQIRFNLKGIYLGSFNTENEAAIAYNKKAIELFGDFAVTNQVIN